MTATSDRFDERRLRADIVATWGEHGAHADVFDFMLAEIRSLRAVVRQMVKTTGSDCSVEQFDTAEVGDRFRVTDEQFAAVQRALDSGSDRPDGGS